MDQAVLSHLSDLHQKTAQDLHRVSANTWEMHMAVGAPVFALLRREEHPKYLLKPCAGETDSGFLGVFHFSFRAVTVHDGC